MSASTETDILAGLDFTVELPCEVRSHAEEHVATEPASMLVRFECPKCRRGQRGLLCESGYALITGAPLVLHSACGSSVRPGDLIKEVTPL